MGDFKKQQLLPILPESCLFQASLHAETTHCGKCMFFISNFRVQGNDSGSDSDDSRDEHHHQTEPCEELP